ncbi:MAG: hypothetical protein D6790_16040, partial [Caldilineae bacterium]
LGLKDASSNARAEREVNLTGAVTATLSFDWFVLGGVETVDTAVVEMSSDGGQSYTVIHTYTNFTAATSGHSEFDITPYISANTRVRFRIAQEFFGSDEYFKVDNVTITGWQSGAAIGDRVWYDLDGQGDQDPGEVGIPGVTVRLRQGACTGTVLNTQTTGVDGSYLFSNLSAGDYCVDVDASTLPAPGYTHTTSNDPQAVTLAADEQRLDVDFGYVAGLCLPTIDFETDAAGNSLTKGQTIDNEWAGWGVTVSAAATAPGTGPAMIFDSANPTGGDTDLGSPNQDFGGPGVGAGGESGMPGENSQPLKKVLIISEDGDANDPDDNANGGTITFTFDHGVRVDQVQILDIDNDEAGGAVTAYDATSGGNVIASAQMLGLGDNSFQVVPLNAAAGVRRLEIAFPSSGAVPAIVFCGTPPQLQKLGDFIWSDLDGDGRQDAGEPGIKDVTLELYLGATKVDTTQTDASGVYTFTNLPAGSYTVKLPASNFDPGGPLAGAVYSPKDATGDDANDSDFDPNTGLAPAVVTAGSDNLTVDGGFRTPTPAFTVSKRLVTQEPVQRGELVRFHVVITNTGNITLTTVPLTDTYDTTYLTLMGSTPLPVDTTNDGLLNWDDLTQGGNQGFGVDLGPGQHFSVTVEFVGRADTTHISPAQAPCTTIGQTCNVATVGGVLYDPDGPGGAPPQGPLPSQSAHDDVEVLAPTAVDLADATVADAYNGVTLAWRTINETNILGFYVWRGADGPTARLEDSWTPAAALGQSTGAAYQYVDRNVAPGVRYIYELEILDLDGGASFTPLGSVDRPWLSFVPNVMR